MSTPTLSVPFNVTQTTIAVTGSSQQVVAANPIRRYLAWMVVGTQDVTITAGAAAAVAGVGMIYAAGGAGAQGGSESWTAGAPTNAFQCIAGGAGSTLIVWEGV
jgi:hypothetical protein